MLPLPHLSHRMLCCLTSAPVGNTYSSSGLGTKCLVQFIMSSIAYLIWDDFFLLHSAFRFSIMEAGLQHCNTQEVLYKYSNFLEVGL